MRAPQINELCEEVMSQSKTPRVPIPNFGSESKTPRHDQLHAEFNADWNREILSEARASSMAAAHCGKAMNLAETLESELTRLSAEKAEVEQRYSSSLDDGLRKSTMYNEALDRAEKAESALLQAREDALEEAAQVCESRISRRPTAYGEQPYIVADFCAAYIRALKSARQAEPQEGEKG